MADTALSEITANKTQNTQINRGYSRFIKAMRFILPLIALILITIIMTWSETDNKILSIEEVSLLPNTDLAENELLNPKFESVDKDLNPYTVRATRALQNQENADLLKLENPNGNMILKDGQTLNIKALNGTYEQKEEKLFLQENVKLEHQSGYILETQELRVDLKKGQAFSDKDVQITGVDGTINATGLEGDTNTEILIFKGPATLIINNNTNGENNVF